jgi:hypothetical protein
LIRNTTLRHPLTVFGPHLDHSQHLFAHCFVIQPPIAMQSPSAHQGVAVRPEHGERHADARRDHLVIVRVATARRIEP